MRNPFLVGAQVYLRPLERADAPVLAGYLNDAEVRRSLRSDRPLSVAEEEEFIDRIQRSRDDVVLGIVRREGDRLLGVVGLHGLQDPSRQAQFGIFIGDPGEWGKGHGTEATALVVGYGFATLNLNRIWLHVYDHNRRGIRVYEKVGFREEGILRQAVFREGRYCDVITMALLRQDWKRPPDSSHPR